MKSGIRGFVEVPGVWFSGRVLEEHLNKGGMTMNLKKMLFIIGCVTAVALIAPVFQVIAGVGPEPPSGATIQGPEIWGEVTVYCSPSVADVATVRVKRVVDCNVEAQALIDPNWQFGCSDDPNSPLKWSLPAGTQFFDIPGTPFINKVKNYTKNVQGDGVIYSFDAQFMFWLP
jgi:hypothetical protein